jgi:hypothetical protein
MNADQKYPPGQQSSIVRLPLRITSDEAHIEHNESALTLTADMPADRDSVAMGQKASSPVARACTALGRRSNWSKLGNHGHAYELTPEPSTCDVVDIT